MDSWMLLKEEAEKFFKLKEYQKACDHYKDALTKIENKFDESNHELTVEAAKISSNISLMYYKLSNEQNDESLLLESKTAAKKTIRYNSKWIEGYLRLADVCKQSKDVDDILNVITAYLQDNKDDVLTDDFISLLKDMKYYTHKSIMELSPSWHLVKYKDNVFVVDSLGAGNFKDFEEFLNCHGRSVQRISVLVRPGIYVGTYKFTNANIDIVGDSNIEINPTTKAIDKNPTVIFTNTLVPTTNEINLFTAKSTLFFTDSEVSLKRITIYGEMNDLPFAAIACERTVINLLECCFVSKCCYSLFCFESSKLYCKRVRSVGGFGGLTIHKSHTRLTDCFISEMDGIGIEAASETEMIKLKHCTVTKCKKQGLLVHNGTKMAKVKESHFENNCSTTTAFGIITLSGCRALVENTSIIQSHNSISIFIEGGSVNCVNVKIENCLTGIFVQGNIEINNCFINNCSKYGIVMYNFLKGNVVLENNNITNCAIEIARSDNAPIPTFKGEKKHAMITFPSVDPRNENMFKEIRKSRREVDILNSKYVCGGSCSTTESVAQLLSKKTLKVCEACKMVLYCSPECQRKHWKLHKTRCDIYVKTKLAAIEGIKANQLKKEKDFNKSEENDGSDDIIVKKEATE